MNEFVKPESDKGRNANSEVRGANLSGPTKK